MSVALKESKRTVVNDIITTEKSKISDLWKKEDWLAVWIGFILIIAAAVGVITGSFDFSAAKFDTWGNGVSLLEQLNGAFFGKLALTALVLGVLFSVGAALKGESLKKYIPAYFALFVLAVIVRLISSEFTLNR